MSRRSSVQTGRSKTDEAWRRYERAMFNELYYMYRPPQFVVLPDYKEIEGLITEGKRQIDIVVLDAHNAARPFLAVESKFYSRRVDVKAVEAFIGMQQDVGAQHAVMVAPNGFSAMALRRVRNTNIQLVTLPTIEADRLNWREVVRAVFTLDETFHQQMGDAVHVFNTTQGYDNLAALMEELPFEEWDTLFYIYRIQYLRQSGEEINGLLE